MKVALLILLLVVPRLSLAQDSTRAKRIEYVLGASAAFGLLDYLGYNLTINTKPEGKQAISRPLYRSLQAIVQAAISYALYKTCGLNSAIAFNLIWWSWADDLAYYGYQYVFNVRYPWPNRSYRDDLADDHITWAGWTPIGIMRPAGSAIARNALFAQSFIGFGISMAILW